MMSTQYSPSPQSLIKENQKLKHQLREAYVTIKALRQQNEILQERLAEYENEQTTLNQNSNRSSEEVFTQSSGNDPEDELQLDSVHLKHYNSAELQQRASTQQIPPLTITKVVSQENRHIRKTPPKLFSNLAPINNQSNNEPKEPKSNGKKRQKNFHPVDLVEDDHSAIKNQQSIFFKGPNQSIFNKVKTSKPIFSTFFITGFNESTLQSEISYFYPKKSQHFPALLSLLYSDSKLRYHQNSGSLSKSPKTHLLKSTKYTIKDTFIIPVGNQTEKNQEKEYVVVAEVDDVLEINEKNLCAFSRFLCFITNCKFYTTFERIMTQLIDKINIFGRPSNFEFQACMKQQIQENLKNLSTHNVEENQYANFSIGNQMNVFIDVPSAEESYKNVIEFSHKNLLSLKIQVSNSPEGSLLGYLLVYIISEVKVILYSLVKSKISQSLLQILEMIKPLEYVNPIILAALKDEHEEYLGAPMSLILGLWGETRRGKQKLEIFMNKKENLNGLIEKGKLQIEDGIVINLDTGYIFGGGISEQKNELAAQLNDVMEHMCRSTKEKYKLFEKLMRTQLEHPKLKSLSEKLKKCLSNTQLFAFFNETRNALSFIDN